MITGGRRGPQTPPIETVWARPCFAKRCLNVVGISLSKASRYHGGVHGVCVVNYEMEFAYRGVPGLGLDQNLKYLTPDKALWRGSSYPVVNLIPTSTFKNPQGLGVRG
jgi:hypothetical protein